MSGIVDAGIVPSIEKDTTATAPSSSAVEDLKTSVADSSASATDSAAKSSMTQSILHGPVVENVKDQHVKTKAEIQNLAASRTTPVTTTATNQQLTHYHSFFQSLLSWQNPRATGIAFASVVAFIFAVRYLDILRYAFKFTWMTLGITVLAEAAGKTILGSGLTSQFRPRKYYTIPKETLNSMISDLHELINFFVIESQRVVFAENLLVSAAAFLGAFFSYFLIKVVPFWGLALISTSALFLGPLVYKTNKELIDHNLTNISEVVNKQTEQVKQIASHHAARATDVTKQYVGDYSTKAQELIGARARSVSPNTAKKDSAPKYKSSDFPAAPKEDFKAPPVGAAAETLKKDEPLIST